MNKLELSHGNFDQYQMDNMSFDVEKRAWRMSLVDGITLSTQSINFPEMKFPEQRIIEVPVIVKETEFKIIEVPVITREIQVLEVQVPIITKEYEKIEVPVIIKETELKIVEIPVIVKEVEIRVIEKEVYNLPMFAKVCMVVQTMALIGLMFSNIFSKGK